MYASGPFTRVVFAIREGYLEIGTPRTHPEGQAGDLVNTIYGHEVNRTYRWR